MHTKLGWRTIIRKPAFFQGFQLAKLTLFTYVNFREIFIEKKKTV